MTHRPSHRLLPATLGVVVLFGSPAGCALQQRAAVKMVDPTLREQGQELERGRKRGGLRIGDYEVSSVRVKETATAVERELFSTPVPGRRVVGYDLGLTLRSPGAEREWTATCTGQRRQSADADFAAAADEKHDDVAIACRFALAGHGGSGAWDFTAEGNLGRNVGGTLRRADGGADHDERGRQVEILMWFKLWKFLDRHLPAPVGQVRVPAAGGDDERVIAAMILSRPERAWVEPSASPEERDASLAALLALRYLPLGFDDG